MELAIIFVTGVIVGCILVTIKRRVDSVGAIRIDTTDPDGMYFFLEIDNGKWKVLMSEKYVLVRTYFRKPNSQK